MWSMIGYLAIGVAMTRLALILVLLLLANAEAPADDNDDRLARELVGLVRDPQLPTRSRLEAAKTLTKLGPRAAVVVPDLMAQLSRLRGTEHELLQETIIDALGQMGSPARKALPTLARTTGRSTDIDQSIKRATKLILAASDAEDVEVLKRQLESQDASLRLRAAKALGALGPVARGAVEGLSAILDDSDTDVRRATVAALRLIQPGTKPSEAMIQAVVKDLAETDSIVRYTAARTLGRFGSAAASAAPALQPLLADPDPDVRRAAADALGRVSAQ